jgi:hypothetical protein
MSKRTVAGIVVAVSLLTGAAAQQKPASPTPKPQFSGTWIVTSPADQAGQTQTVTQDAETLTIEHQAEGGSRKMSYQLDNVERRLAIPGRGSEITMLARATWDAGRIVITTNVAYPNGMKTQSKEVWSIDDQRRLVIDYSETGPTGAGPSVKVIHVKK